MFHFDPMYFIFAAPGLILALFASFRTKSTFSKYAEVMSRKGYTGAQAAARLLSAAGVNNVKIEETGGFLSDHYDPSSRTLRLSHDVYTKKSLSAIGVACHEAGHALQHAESYYWLGLRSSLVPLTNIGSTFSYIVITLGFILSSQSFILIGAALFSAAVIFSLVTLPVEYDATRRAKALMVDASVVTPEESSGAGAVLDAAFLTYVAAAVSSLLTLAYYLLRAGVLGRKDD